MFRFSCLSDTTHRIIMVAEAISEVNSYCRNKQLVYTHVFWDIHSSCVSCIKLNAYLYLYLL